MKKLLFCLLGAACMWAHAAAADVAAEAKAALEKVTPGTIAYRAGNGWLYSKNELTHLAKGELAGGKVTEVSACRKPQTGLILQHMTMLWTPLIRSQAKSSSSCRQKRTGSRSSAPWARAIRSIPPALKSRIFTRRRSILWPG